jgi:CRP/FNR family transcriptional regulator, polysaccharide utilization system transcription regulator
MQEKKNLKNIKESIIRLPIFKTLTEEQLEILQQNYYEVKFRPGETIFKQGMPMTHIVLIVEGMVKVYLEGINHRNLILRISGPITMIGGPGFFTDFKHHLTSLAIEETTAWFLDVNIITEIIKQNKDFALGLLKWVNAHTVSNYMKFIELTQKGMHGRIAGALLYLQNEVFKGRDAGIHINRQDLADLTAMSKESAIRILKELKDENIISVEGSSIVLNDMDKLARISLNG